MVVVLLGCVGLTAGVAVTTFGPRSYIVGEEFVLRSHSSGHMPHSPVLDAIRLAALARSQHVQGVRVEVLNGGAFQIVGHGSYDGAARAFAAVATQVRKAVNRMPGEKLLGIPFAHALARPQGNAIQTGAIGLLAGLSAALGFLVPPRSRVTGGLPAHDW
jgi:hypothetical protein